MLAIISVFCLASMTFAQFTFYLIDNFEGGNFLEGSKWWRFGDLTVKTLENQPVVGRDLIAESCGTYSLSLSGETNDWYVGGIGTDIGVDASEFSRFQIDISGNEEYHGKLIVEFFDDDNNNYTIEQDPQKNYMPIFDDKWVAEINIQGKGFTRTSIPFSAFKDVNPGVGDDIWNPDQKNGSGGLMKLQFVAISENQKGKVDFTIDNLLLTY
ncbi:hypothetical protein COT42_06890 [Candidatus Saganbacteria bacterium CG08_land_8_20_14_0_20_45_16]|uniref:NADH:ubiquinone oxidoreductase intermediate-associated protein 30 domain-containing protein n=1 Tax=Candidatus Saganbacteria bacterium CG08_land_8_20_14_0_20_45_16 TaxID=2014293 RepID=A0A2H0XXF8_UNCSA|nr:MAG: hypothetical protein COT42_06890 [Candidatus Saganbacteria bacterium CG08_land_8_20_14_0_20_45_16]